MLLECNCPEMYRKLEAKGADKEWLAIKKSEVDVLPEIYLSTDIYAVSREIRKMQKLDSNILTAWYEQDSLKIEQS